MNADLFEPLTLSLKHSIVMINGNMKMMFSLSNDDKFFNKTWMRYTYQNNIGQFEYVYK